jgi:hypothetical protein
MLAFKLKQKRVNITQQFPLHCEQESDKFLSNNVIGDESLVHNSNPGNKRQLMKFHYKSSINTGKAIQNTQS